MTVDRDDKPDDEFLASFARLGTCDVSAARANCAADVTPCCRRSHRWRDCPGWWMGRSSDGTSSRRSAARGVSRTSWRSSAAPRQFTATLARRRQRHFPARQTPATFLAHASEPLSETGIIRPYSGSRAAASTARRGSNWCCSGPPNHPQRRARRDPLGRAFAACVMRDMHIRVSATICS